MNYKRTLSNYLDHRTDPAKVAVALLAGLAVGAILGVLFAPHSGEDTRYRISDKAKGLANDAKDRVQSKFRAVPQDAVETDAEAKAAKPRAKTKVANAHNSSEPKSSHSKAKNISVDQNGSIQGI